jgi:hypothetical protein
LRNLESYGFDTLFPYRHIYSTIHIAVQAILRRNLRLFVLPEDEESSEISEVEDAMIEPVYTEREVEYDAFSEMINKME